MKKLIYALLILLITAPLWAAPVSKTGTFVAPTERVNGDPLLSSEIASYDLVCQDSETGTPIYTATVPGADTTFETGEVFEAGSYVCQMRTVDTGGLVSPDWSTSNVFIVGRCDVTDCRPQAPRSIIIALDR